MDGWSFARAMFEDHQWAMTRVLPQMARISSVAKGFDAERLG